MDTRDTDPGVSVRDPSMTVGSQKGCLTQGPGLSESDVQGRVASTEGSGLCLALVVVETVETPGPEGLGSTRGHPGDPSGAVWTPHCTTTHMSVTDPVP